MSLDWSLILTPQQLLRNERTRSEVERLSSLPDRWLAEELLRLARRMRQDFPEKLGNPHANSYSPALVWHLVPEIARRLGASRLQPNEATYGDISGLTGPELRQVVGVFLQHGNPIRWMSDPGSDRPSAGEILGHHVANGNPLAIAMDRLVPPPKPEAVGEDWLALRVYDASIRRGHEPVTDWSPGLQQASAEKVLGDQAPEGMAPGR